MRTGWEGGAGGGKLARQTTAEMWLLLMPPLLTPLLLMPPLPHRILPNQHQYDWSKRALPAPYTCRLGGKTQHGRPSEATKAETSLVLTMLMLKSAAPVEAASQPACSAAPLHP